MTASACKESKAMRDALRRMLDNCGEINRRKGGYWTTQSARRDLDWWVGLGTMRALERRGLVYVDEFARSPFYVGAICYRLTHEGFEAAEHYQRELERDGVR